MPTVTPDPVAAGTAVPIPAASTPTQYRVAARTLYAYYNKGATITAGRVPQAADVASRSLYSYYSKAATSTAGRVQQPADVDARSLYAYANRAHDRDPTDVPARSLYLYEARDNTELFPWIEKIAPTEQLPGGQITIYGDGFGATEGAEGSIVRLGSPADPTQPGPGTALGVVAWQTRSPGLWPANGGTPTEPAITATVPDEAESGMISIEQTT